MAEVPRTVLLLQDIVWLKGLATRLANNRDDADDLVQEAWIAAWRHRPDPTRPMRAWLTKVVCDLAGMKRRSDRRRATRNAHADQAQAPAAPDESLAQIRLHKRLAELVIELDEPYRSTIIARFVEGRTSAAIAQALGIPAGTVRKRLHEALSRLRAGLDADAGDRNNRAPAVLAFTSGGIQVAKSTKLVVLVLAALLLVSAVTLLVVVSVRGDGTTASTRSSKIAASSDAAPAGPSLTAAATDASTRPASEHRAGERAAMLVAIAKAREARGASIPTPANPGAPATTSTDSTATTLDIIDNTGDTSDWQMRARGTLNRLLGQCYDLGHAEDPSLQGTLAVRFKIVGEPDVGGLLEHIEILDGDTTITQATVRDCVTQQLYALELDPPPAGVSVERELHLEY